MEASRPLNVELAKTAKGRAHVLARKELGLVDVTAVRVLLPVAIKGLIETVSELGLLLLSKHVRRLFGDDIPVAELSGRDGGLNRPIRSVLPGLLRRSWGNDRRSIPPAS